MEVFTESLRNGIAFYIIFIRFKLFKIITVKSVHPAISTRFLRNTVYVMLKKGQRNTIQCIF